MAEHQKGQNSGPWSRREKAFIAKHANDMTYEQIASTLKRNPVKVKKYLRNVLGLKSVISGKSALQAEYDIQASPIWKELEAQFTMPELELFMYHWRRIIGQFKDDVFPTEELQVVDAIRVELLMSRILKNQAGSIRAISDLEAQQQEEKAKPISEQDFSRLDNIGKQLAFYRGAFETLSKEYADFLNKKSSMLKDLRATRAERVKRVEESKQTFAGWMAELIRNPDLRRSLGIKMEKMRIAIDVEKVRLMHPHKYADGIEDHPLLVPEVISQEPTINPVLQEDDENEEYIGGEFAEAPIIAGPTQPLTPIDNFEIEEIQEGQDNENGDSNG